MKKLVIFLLAALLLTGCGASGPAAPVEPTATPAEARTAEPTQAPTEAPAADADAVTFSTTDREGVPWDESVFADHSVTMLNFWEPWCGPCVGEMPELQQLQDDYADRGLQILGIYQTPGMEADVDAVLQSTGVTYPILHYTGAFDRFQTGYVPTTVFVDSEGRVIGQGDDAFYVGSNSYDGWAAILEGLL